MRTNRLQLNTNKTDLPWCSTARRQRQLPTTALRVGPDRVSPSPWVRDLGIFIDADLSMRTQVQRTVASCFATLRQLRSIRRSVPASVYQSLVVALVLSRLDYGNITLIGIPAYQLRPLQSVMNATVRSITDLRRSDHITDTLASLHWLRSSAWAHPVQASDDGVSVTARSRPTVLIRLSSSLGEYPVAATSTVRVFAAARRAAHSSSYHW